MKSDKGTLPRGKRGTTENPYDPSALAYLEETRA